ncbi:neither inactivation nor afterpotential protein G isoform X2 [Athalia rosae]|uniref:neither inactivation nor afterpotential protein G isoform X2 n=1 Tax=Athalia rosae TaxID=37344 RepID=UPI002033D86C|nr:neither inactivation nor afterpotential protein G isoform X2 [Athalia rosae]
MWNLVLLSLVCLIVSLIYNFYLSEPISIVRYPKKNYDYIVGAGTAGCVIASRLSESKEVSVLLVEAGGYFKWHSSIPLAAPLLQRTNSDWAYATDSQEYSSRGLRHQKQFWPRGKGLGGSGQMNFVLHSFGVPEDYSRWPAEWSYKNLLPYFRRVEEIINITVVSAEEKLARAFHKSGIEIAHKNATFSLASNTLKKGARSSSYHAYLKRAWSRKNLHILMNALVTKILFTKLRAEGIQVKYSSGKVERIMANKEIILCGGTVNTPQLLMLSGIGPVDELRKHHIPVVKQQEQVGRNLYDHLNVPIYVNLKAPVSVTLNKLKSFNEIFKFFVFGNGMLASNAIVGTGRSGHSGILLFGMGTVDESLLKEIANFHTSTFRAVFPSYADPKLEGFIYLSSCLQPESRGNITLRSNESSDSPIINPGYLESDHDIECTHNAIQLALETLTTTGFVDLGASAHVPKLRECSNWPQDYTNHDFTECLTRTVGLTSHHPGGTCRMGKNHDSTAVVDEDLRVIGVDGLRIMDASVLPYPVSGTPNSVIIAMAERAADIIVTWK